VAPFVSSDIELGIYSTLGLDRIFSRPNYEAYCEEFMFQDQFQDALPSLMHDKTGTKRD
jgi:hypothetical protein